MPVVTIDANGVPTKIDEKPLNVRSLPASQTVKRLNIVELSNAVIGLRDERALFVHVRISSHRP